MSSSIIKLNVGGQTFQTTKSTLTRFDGFFKTILETDIPLSKDENGQIFIDRSPRHFESILDFLRDGRDAILPISEQDILKIQQEAQFYLLTGLVELCQSKMKPAEVDTSVKLQFIKNDDELMQAIANITDKPVLIVEYSLRECSFDDYPRGVNIPGFVLENDESFDIYFRENPKATTWTYDIYDNVNGWAKCGVMERFDVGRSQYWNTQRNKLKKSRQRRY